MQSLNQEKRQELIKFCKDSAAYFETHQMIDFDKQSDERLIYYTEMFDDLWLK